MGQSDTIERILGAASALFAERGYTETSLRTITSTANVNLAAVNYHFGSKKALIQAVFARFLTPLADHLEKALDKRIAAKGEEALCVDELIDALFSSLLATTRDLGENQDQFMRLLMLAYTQSQEHLRHFIIAEYGQHYSRFTGLLREAMPEVKPEVFYWRLYFMLGASVFTLSSFDSIRNILKADFDKDSSVEDAVNLLVPAITGMLNREDD
ncbi:TetR/AcrR family transcriptional regulator [Pseudomaricurvus alkylphenolicus]|jgi:AcrR family transcriptional regulator|uniref:TetR/AcrR family transcriptional regulator n=1 Tax=Pseudomaricurvus alkylphenolicus TaxID=1306991 RepID=UPI0014223779|nr:TetR/AcrR family transcriptional regulator [Pseudomaricurvus alkylphenolicus]NIB41283.1 TetR/AcrR family transcriptional regulator [Pseudomaricurvus alkylphenolicus]